MMPHLRLALTLLLLAAAAGANAQPANLLANASFEIEADGEPGPDGWHGDPATFAVAQGEAWHGDAYLRCVATGGHAGLWQAIRGLEPDTSLTLTARLRRPDGKAVTGLRVLATDPTWHWAADARKIGDDQGWELHQVAFTTPPTPMQFLRLRIHLYPEAEGETHLDGLTLYQGEDTGPYATREGRREPEQQECARAVSAVAGGIFLDFGPDGQPVMPGFAAAGADAAFSDDTGRGWLPGARLEAVLRTAQGGVVPRPDPLCGDFVRVSGEATFRVVVPPGQYHLTVWLGDVARYSSEDHDYEIRANGGRLFGEHVSPREFLEEWYLAGANRDLAPETEDLFDFCVAPRFPRHEFVVDTGAGELDLAFQAGGSVCVDGLALVPAAMRQAGQAALARVEGLRRLLFADATPAAIEGPAATPEGPSTFAPGVNIWQRRLHDEAGGPISSQGLRLAACPGEEETIALVLASRDTLREVRAEVGQFEGPQGGEIGADASRSEWLLLRPVPVDHHIFDENRCVVKGDLLAPGALPALGPARPRECWLTVTVPDDTRPGLYRAAVRLSASGEPLAEIPLRLRVRPFGLAPLDYACGPYYYPPGYYRSALGNLPVTDPGFLRLIEQELRVARRMGFNMVSRFPWPRLQMVDEGLQLDYSWTDTYMALVAKVGLTGAIPGYQGMTHMLAPRLAEYAPEGSERFTELLRQVIADVRDRGRQRGWPEVMVYLGDEFTLTEAESRFAALARAAHGVEGVRTICNGYWKAIPVIAPWLDIALAPTPPPEEARDKLEGTPCVPALYNCGLDRSSLGLYTAAHPGPVRLEWHFQYVMCDPHNYLDSTAATERHSMVLPGPERPYWRACAFALREGIDDYRYWLTLKQLVADAEREGRPVPQRAVKLLEEAAAGGSRWPAEKCAELRDKIAQVIEDLSGAH